MPDIEKLKPMAQRVAEDTLNLIEHVRGVIVATEDGFMVSESAREKLDSARLSAIASSLGAMGEVVGNETRLGAIRSLIIDADDGYFMMRTAKCNGIGLIIAVLASSEALLGNVIRAVSEASIRLSVGARS